MLNILKNNQIIQNLYKKSTGKIRTLYYCLNLLCNLFRVCDCITDFICSISTKRKRCSCTYIRCGSVNV
ncbi:hypothetical protein J6I39_01575 [bacterium]|nr:hypothetical protein [bacterium]